MTEKEEYVELSLQEKYDQAIAHTKNLRTRIQELNKTARMYNRLRELEVVIMAKEGAVYLKGEELDNYINSLPPEGLRPISSAQFTKAAMPVLNQIFTEEYDRYKAEHADHIAAQIDAEAMLNVKT